MAKKTIELDCAPGFPRPGDLIGDVIEGTGLELRDASSALFGNWTWNYDDVDDVTWKKAQPILKQRITDLYNKNKIRYGSW